MRDGSTKTTSVSVHPDARVHAVVEQGREAEILQAIDRLRLIHSERRKTVFILCSVPLDIPVDELVTWKQLIGDRRLSDALGDATRGAGTHCRWRRRSCAGSFPACGIRRRPPSIGPGKNPPEAYRDIIRVWGSLRLIAHQARRAGRRRSSATAPMRGWRWRACWGCPPRTFG
jgi:hypothetical protein